MNTLYTILTTPPPSSIERVFLHTSKRGGTDTKSYASVVIVLAIIILITASIFTAPPVHASPRENRLALGDAVFTYVNQL